METQSVSLITECVVGVAWPVGWVTLDLSFFRNREEHAQGNPPHRIPLIGMPPAAMRDLAKEILRVCDEAESEVGLKGRPAH